MQKFTLYLGLNDRQTKAQKITTDKAVQLINQTIGDCTISTCMGTYTDLSGKTTLENTLKIELLDFNNNIDIDFIIQKLGILFNQESIAFEQQKINTQLVYIKHKQIA